MVPRIILLTPVLLCLCLSSCSLGFASKWKKAAAQPAVQAEPLSGAWQGTWRSDKNGHSGELLAIVTPKQASKGKNTTYTFRYKATWQGFLSAVFEAEHLAQPGQSGGPWLLSGEKHLGLLAGVYRFSGTATPTHFRARYVSLSDEGVFEMKRPESPRPGQ
ncbi:MAG: hypothetical protein ACOYMN_14815 [Roseimicrobium sp.]